MKLNLHNHRQVAVAGAFDDFSSRSLRFLQEAARFGDLTVLLWSDEVVVEMEDRQPGFPLQERLYVLQAVRYARRVTTVTSAFDEHTLPPVAGFRPDVWVITKAQDHQRKRTFCEQHGLQHCVLSVEQLRGFPCDTAQRREAVPPRKKVLVTGSFDWFHSGHVRFFEEASAYGDLYVVVGHDANIQRLKGVGHPMFPQEERRYVVQSIRFVTAALISTGHGWLDAEPEIERIKPDIYAVNEDGDRGGKRDYCEAHGIRYLVLRRTPAPGLPRRSSTDFRGF